MGFAKAGSEFYANATTVGDQIGSRVIELTGGGIVIAWTDLSQVAGVNSADIRGQRFAEGGLATTGAEFILNTTRGSSQSGVALTALGNGGFAAAWTDYAAMPANADLPWTLESGAFQTHAVTQVFTASATKSGGEITHFLDDSDYPTDFYSDPPGLVSAGPHYLDSHQQFNPALTADLSSASDDFTLAVVEELHLEDTYFLSPIPPIPSFVEIGMNNIALFDESPDFLVDHDQNANWDYESSTVFAPSLDVPHSFAKPVMITLGDGDVVTAYELHFWESSPSASWLNKHVHVEFGLPSGPVHVGSEYAQNAALAELGNGNVVVVWEEEENDIFSGTPTNIKGQLFTPAGVETGGEFTIDTSSGDTEDPAIAALADGRFVVVWVDANGDSSGTALKAQMFTEDAVKSGKEFLVNTVTADDQFEPDVAALSNGDFIVTWTSADGSTADIKAQVFDAQTYDGDGADETVYGGSFDDTINGLDGEDVLRGGAGDDHLYGGDENDVLYGQADDDYLSGGYGDDEMHGGGGDDTFVVFETGDEVLEGEDNGYDTVQSSIDYTLPDNVENLSAITIFNGLDLTGNDLGNTISGGNVSDDTLSGLGGDDWLEGQGGEDTLLGGAGIDYLFGGEGGDRMEGGSGGDTYFVDSINDEVVEQLVILLPPSEFDFDYVSSTIDYTLGDYVERLGLDGTENINGTGNTLANKIYGNSGDNALFGLDLNDELHGFDGDDRLDGGSGADILKGGADDDTYIVDNIGDRLTELEDEGDFDRVDASISAILPANVEVLNLTGTANLSGIGNFLDNTLNGNIGNNMLTGVTGDDALYGSSGADILWGGQGGDTLNGGPDSDTVIYTGSDVGVYADIGANLNFGGHATGDTFSSIENLWGSSFDDVLVGYTGNNYLNGGAGADVMGGYTGNDTYVVDNALDSVIEQAGWGIDTVRTTLVSYTLGPDVERLVLLNALATSGVGNTLANAIIGGANGESLQGLAGIDGLSGFGGNDTLRGGTEADALDGGEGTDTASYASAAAAVNVALDGGLAATGEAIGDTFVSIEYLQGSNSATGDSLRGDSLANSLFGLAGNDTLRGLDGGDQLIGAAGADTLQGDLGNDKFNYYAASEGGDILVDFANAANNDDAFQFLSAAFGGLPQGVLAATRFVVRASDNLAQDADDIFIFQTNTRQLWYDATGNAAAGDAVLIATLQAGAAMTNADVIIF